MARTVIDNDLIIKMNELYLQIKTYAGVSRALGGTPSPSTVKKYIIPNYTSRKNIKKTIFNWSNVLPKEEIKLEFKDCGDLCEMSLIEFSEIKELWEELSI